MEKLRTLDLFSGIGGFTLGLDSTGYFETVAFCEIEAFPCKVLNKHWPEVPIYNDVKELSYEKLQAETEYAAWMYVNGFCANHFTVDVNKLENFTSLQQVNEFLKENGYKMNISGGEIKGTPQQMLEQSSILADKIPVDFLEGTKEITSCYYEFAFRHPMNNGVLYSGFIAGSADKIFESTDMKFA